MKFGTLGVLLWKHCIVRKKRIFKTALELVSVFLFFLVVFLYRQDFKPEMKQYYGTVKDKTIEYVEPLKLKSVLPPTRILYSPDTEHSKTIMDIVVTKLLGPLYVACEPLTDSARINISNITDNSIAIVYFQDFSADEWPDKLNYTIRINDDYQTATYTSFDNLPIIHSRFGIIYESFMRLQWAIDTTYIEQVAKKVYDDEKKIDQTVTLHEFPYVHVSVNNNVSNFCDLLYTICVYSVMLIFVFTMSQFMQERASGIQELMKMLGVSSNKLILSHVLNVIIPGLVYSVSGAVFTTSGTNPVLSNSNRFLIFTTLLIYFFSVIAFAIACSFIMKNAQYATSMSTLAFLALVIPENLLEKYEMARHLVYLSGLLPHVPLMWVWKEIGHLEMYGGGLTFSAIMQSHTTKSGSVLAAWFFMLVQMLYAFFIAWYLDRVRPGQYGQALPWNFLCQSQYWRKNDVNPDFVSDEEEPIGQDQRYFENAPANHDVGIKVVNVSKVFPKQRALNNVSLEVYRGEITVLLGHNGAGKTTLMSIITGMYSPTEGKVYVNGQEITSQREATRQNIGLCPQHNLFFDDLNVLDHVAFFTLLKGTHRSYSEVVKSSLALLEQLGLQNKCYSMSGELSGGMKRRLQLACALAGDASVLILDEPTSGLDVETRRELWDLLLSLRGSRTVLLSTHFMEEADALGDRVAALHSGALRCLATPMYLKKAIGTGYRLTFTTTGLPKEAAITDVIHSVVPDATVKESSLNSVGYNLPATSSGDFPQLFNLLEDKRMELGIDSIGVGISTLEEVFLNLCSDTSTTFAEDETDGAADGNGIKGSVEKVTRYMLYLRQFGVLMKRQVNFVLSRKIIFLILQVILPITMIVLVMLGSNSTKWSPPSNPPVAMNLGLYPMGDAIVLHNLPENKIHPYIASYPNVEFKRVKNAHEEVLRSGKKSPLSYSKYLMGIEMNDMDVKISYNTAYRHTAPVALNLASNVVRASLLPATRAITVTNHPITSGKYSDAALKEPKDLASCIILVVFVVFIIMATNCNMVVLTVKERVSGARHTQLLAGAATVLHWAATATAHVLLCVGSLLAPALLAFVLLERDHTLDDAHFVVTLGCILLLGSLALFAVMYIVCIYFEESGSNTVLLLYIIFFGLVTPLLKALDDVFDESRSWADALLRLVSYTTTPHALTAAAVQAAASARLNALCALNRARCPDLASAVAGFDPARCCESLDGRPYNYLSMTAPAPGTMMLCLALQFFVFTGLLLATQYGLFQRVYDKVMNLRYAAAEPAHADDMVRAERLYVDKAISLPKEQITDSMLVSNLHKNYRLLRGSCNAVKGISFSVKKGECFGLLGVNGAGKSTTFKMLTGEICPTRGKIFANGHFLEGHNPQYLQSLGYCPQFFGLDDFQTGRDNLHMLLTLRGLRSPEVVAEANTWIKIVGLEKYADRPVSGYSGGCVRRLSAAAALAVGAPLTLLDEPTAGVDVSARRRVWRALRRALHAHRAVIITSHSMDEMEALCHRIGIMCAGRLCALGSPAGLRAAHAAGHAVVLKVRHLRPASAAPAATGSDETDSSPQSQLKELKGFLQRKFNCTLKDEHKTKLHYHINETMQYSELFKELEELKRSFPLLVEDYYVTETTLEEVFLSYARSRYFSDPAHLTPV